MLIQSIKIVNKTEFKKSKIIFPENGASGLQTKIENMIYLQKFYDALLWWVAIWSEKMDKIKTFLKVATRYGIHRLLKM